jgi:S1/P1 Nuclease
MQRWLLSVLMLVVLGAGPASAWDSFGHMEVATIAWAKLTPTARERAAELLKLNPLYERWIRDIPLADQARVAFVKASTWADDIANEPDYTTDGPGNGFRPPPGPQAAQNIGYADHFRHKYWHFINTPFSPDGTALQEPEAPNLKTQIRILRAALASGPRTSADVRSYDMVWLIHLVGDAHQPLHAASRFTRDLPNGDQGGNAIKVDCGPGCPEANLHAFWDDVLGPFGASLQAVAEAAGRLPAAASAQGDISDEDAWLDESFDLAKAVAYAAPVIGDGSGPYTLTEAYKAKALEVAKLRIALAGIRLANLLNAAFKE